MDFIEGALEVIGSYAFAFFVGAVGEVWFCCGCEAGLFYGDIFESDALDAAGGELGAEEVAEVDFCCVDGGVDDEEGPGRIWVRDAWFVRADVEVVGCWGWVCGCWWELEWKGRVARHFDSGFLHDCGCC